MTSGPLTAPHDVGHPSRRPADGRRDEPAPRTSEPPVPVVDIVIPVHNEAHVLEASVSRLYLYLSERFPLSWRITIVDNGSTDGTWATAGARATRLLGARRLPMATSE